MPTYVGLVAGPGQLADATAHLNVHEAGKPPVVSLRFDDSRFTIQSHDMDPSEFLATIRRLCDDAARQWHVWLDENADTYMLDVDAHLYTCCDGYFEHVDTCTVRAQIDAARRALMNAELADEPADDGHVEYGPAGAVSETVSA